MTALLKRDDETLRPTLNSGTSGTYMPSMSGGRAESYGCEFLVQDFYVQDEEALGAAGIFGITQSNEGIAAAYNLAHQYGGGMCTLIVNSAQSWSAMARFEWLEDAISAATVGDRRLSYQLVYRGLNDLFRTARWTEVASVLSELSEKSNLADLAIAACRFSSGGAKYIPQWASVIERLFRTVQSQGLNAGRLLRGLVKGDPAS